MKEMLTKISGGLGSFKAYWDNLSHNYSHFLNGRSTVKKPVECELAKEYPLITLVEKARIEWEEAQALFNEVKEPELVDHAIYAMEATERKYIYLLKEARKGNVVNEEINQILNNNLVL